MNKLKPSHSVSLPISEDTLVPKRHGHGLTRRNRRTTFSLRGDESPAVELPPLPRWMLNTPINSKFPMIPAPRGKIVLFTTDLCQTLHPTPSGLEFDPSAQGIDSKYKSLHDPHLKNHYWHPDTFERLVRGGFVTPDGKVKCTLKEFNEFQQHLKRVRLEKMDQDHKRLLQLERIEKEQKRYDRVKTADQLAREKRLQDVQKRWKKNNRERQKRLKQQLDAYDAKHACIITEQQLRREIDEVRRELEEQRRLNHKLQTEKEEREKKIAFLQKRAKEERRRAKMLEEREITSRAGREKELEEKWDRKQLSKDSGFAREYLKKQRSHSKMNASINTRKRKTELGWLKQQADLARITEARMKKAAEEEVKITANLEKKLAIIRRRFERKLKRLQAMLRSGGIPPVVQLKRTHVFTARKIQWEHQREMEIQLQKERKIQREIERQREKERQRALERERAASVPPLHIVPDTLPDVSMITGHPSWGEVMSKKGISPEKLPPIKPTSEQEALQEDKDLEKLKPGRDEGERVEEQRKLGLAKDFVSGMMEKAVAKNLVDIAVEKAVASDLVSTALSRAATVAPEPAISELLETPSLIDRAAIEEAVHVEEPSTLDEEREVPEITEEIIEVEDIFRAKSEIQSEPDIIPAVSEVQREPIRVKDKAVEVKDMAVEVKDTPSRIAARTLAMDAIGNACEELDVEFQRVSCRATPSDTARVLACEALEDSIDEIASEGHVVEGIFRRTTSNVGRSLAQDAINDAIDEVTRAEQKAKDVEARRASCRATPSDTARVLAGEALEDSIDEIATEGHVVEGIFRQTPSNVGRGLAQDAIHDAIDEVARAEYELRQTPSNVGQFLARDALLGAVDELEKTTEAKLCLTFKDEPVRGDLEILKEKREEIHEMPKETPSGIAKDLAAVTIGDAVAELQDMADNFLSIDRVVCRQTSSEIARELAESAIEAAANDIEKTEGLQVETTFRQTHSNVARKLAKGAIARAKDDLRETFKICRARKRSFYKSRSLESDVKPRPTRRPRETRSDTARYLAKGAIESAAKDLELEGNVLDVVDRKTPSNLARDLAESAIDEVTKDLDDDHVIHVIYRKTPSNLARILTEDVLQGAQDDLEDEGKEVVASLRKTPSNVARSLAKGALVNAVQELNDQSSQYALPMLVRKTPSDLSRGKVESVLFDVVSELDREGKPVDKLLHSTPSNVARSLAKEALFNAVQELDDQGPQYTLPMTVRKTPSDLGRGIAEGVLLDAVSELEREGTPVETPPRSTPSNMARSLVKTSIADAVEELDGQPSTYLLPKICRKTSSDIARVIARDSMDEAISDFDSEGQAVDGKARLTPSNLARKLVDSAIVNAQIELEEGTLTSEGRLYTLKGKTSSNIARQMAKDVLRDSITEIESEGKAVEGILRKTPSNLGRFLAQDVIGEALEELEEARRSPRSTGTLSRRASRDEIMSTEEADDLQFNEDDIQEMWGNKSDLLSSVIDVFSQPMSTSIPYEEDEDDDNEEVIGILENSLIAEELPALVKSDAALTEIVHINDKDEIVVEGVARITGDEGPLATGSVTEATLSMESLTKNASGQLIRESSDSSTGEDITSSFDDDNLKGPQYFQVVPLYNDKTIDVGDEVIKTNLSVISIKPDVKMALAGAHQPHSRNSFRNIFRPDMTYCEGSARCLKETLVSQFSKQSSTDVQKKVLDECCKVLEEDHPEITARHSDEELVTIGDVEGVCVWPKRRAYQAHIIDEPVPEKTEDGSEEVLTNAKSSENEDCEAKPKRLLPSESQEIKDAVESTQKGKPILNDESNQELLKESLPDSKTSSKHSGSLVNAVVSKLSSIFSRRSSYALPEQEQHESLQSREVSPENGNTESTSISKIIDVTGGKETFSKPDEVDTGDETQNNASSQPDTDKSDAAKNEIIVTAIEGESYGLSKRRRSEFSREEKCTESSEILSEDHSTDLRNKSQVNTMKGRAKESDDHCLDEIDKSVDHKIQDIITSQSKENETKREKIKEVIKDNTEKTPKEFGADSNIDNNNSLDGSTSGKTRKKSGLSVIYVKPADTRLSRSSCTVLVAGKSISHISGDGGSSDRLKTTGDTRSRPPSAILHEVKPRRLSSPSASATAEFDDHHLTVTKAESDDAGLRKHTASQMARRKLSQQTMPSSSHRLLKMTCKLSHSASELDGRDSLIAVSSDISARKEREALWPISRLTSECDSECPEEGARTPDESVSPTNTASRPSPTAAIEVEATQIAPIDENPEDNQNLTSEENPRHNRSEQTNNSADDEGQHATSSSSSSHQTATTGRHGVLGNIISRVFHFGRRRSNQVMPLLISDDDDDEGPADTHSPKRPEAKQEK